MKLLLIGVLERRQCPAITPVQVKVLYIRVKSISIHTPIRNEMRGVGSGIRHICLHEAKIIYPLVNENL